MQYTSVLPIITNAKYITISNTVTFTYKLALDVTCFIIITTI